MSPGPRTPQRSIRLLSGEVSDAAPSEAGAQRRCNQAEFGVIVKRTRDLIFRRTALGPQLPGNDWRSRYLAGPIRAQVAYTLRTGTNTGPQLSKGYDV
jgi:hypothetical protein